MGFIPWAPIGGGRNPSLRKTGNAFEAKRNVTRQPGATRARVVATKIAGHVADPGHIVSHASRGEHGDGETSASCGRVEKDRRFGADELRMERTG